MGPTPDLRITTVPAGTGAIVCAAGELDLATAGDLAATVREQLRDGPVVLDLGGLTFMDSSGVRMLDALVQESDAHGWTFRIRSSLPRNVRQVLELTGMLGALPLKDERPDTP